MNRVSVSTASLLLQTFGVVASLGLAACGPDDEPLEHGTISLQLLVSESEAMSPLPGTAVITASMSYQMCLRTFYNENPDYQPGGEIGATVFGPAEDGGEGWLDRLCDNPEGGQIACEVDTITQRMPQLAIRLNMTSEPKQTQFLKFGPIPRASLAGCEPEMGLEVNPVSGYDAAGQQLWTTETYNPNGSSPEQPGEIQLRIAAVDR